MPRIDQLVKLAEAAGCKLCLDDSAEKTSGIAANFSLRQGSRQILFSIASDWKWADRSWIIHTARNTTLSYRAALYEWSGDGAGAYRHVGQFDHSDKAANVIARFFADVRAVDGGRSVTFDIQGYGRGTPHVTLRSIWDGGRYVIEYVGRDKRVVRDPEGISLAYFRGDIEAGMFLDWLWDEVKL
jgi:hypothetical protein